MPDRRLPSTRLPKASALSTSPRSPADIAPPPPSGELSAGLPKCQPFGVVTSTRRIAPPIPLTLRSEAIAPRRTSDRIRFGLLVAGVSAIVAAAPFVLVDHLSGSLRDAMVTPDQMYEGRSVATKAADGIPLIRANPAPYKRAVPAAAPVQP